MLAITVVYCLGAPAMIRAFMDSTEIVDYGTRFLRVMSLSFVFLCTDFLTVGEGYYLGTTSGHKYFGAGEGFAVGDKLHAIVVDDSDFPEASHSLSVEERFERIIYMTHRHNIVSVWSDGREVVKR